MMVTNFSLKSAYNAIADDKNGPKSHLFKLIWKWKGPQRMKTFLWLAAHDALLKNATRVRRHIAHSNLCPVCGTASESIIHTL